MRRGEGREDRSEEGKRGGGRGREEEHRKGI